MTEYRFGRLSIKKHEAEGLLFLFTAIGVPLLLLQTFEAVDKAGDQVQSWFSGDTVIEGDSLDGLTIEVESARGRDGKEGADGKDGRDGRDGVDGADGLDGEDGAPGRDGAVVLVPIGEEWPSDGLSASCEYEVREGDTLWSIARSKLGVTDLPATAAGWRDIFGRSVGQIGDDASAIDVGQIIVLPSEACD